MSEFDSNPFADPNPFADQSINQARQTTTRPVDEDFNPFAKDQFSQQQPAVLQHTDERPPSYGASNQDSLRKQQEELDRKAADLDRREQEITQNIRASVRAKNFPLLPSCCPIKPCFYQDFNVDIPQNFHFIVKIHFYLWMSSSTVKSRRCWVGLYRFMCLSLAAVLVYNSYSLLLIVNIGGALAYFITSPSDASTNAGTTFGLSILYCILCIPASFICWFRPVYNAFSSDSSVSFFIYFFVFFCQCCAWIVWCIGIPGSGTVGWISGLAMLKTNSGVGVFMIVIGVLFMAMAGLGMLLIVRVLRLYRTTGASFEKAQQEFASGVASNRTVQQATINVASTAARSAAEQSFADNRY